MSPELLYQSLIGIFLTNYKNKVIYDQNFPDLIDAKESFMKYLPFLLLFFSFSAFGESAQECAKLVRTDDRLACFDKLFPSNAEKMIESETVQRQQTSAGSSVRESAAEPRVDVTGTNRDELARTDKSTASRKDEQDSRGFSLGSLGKIFNRDPSADFQSRITELKAGNSQKMVFLLENNQIWLQDSPRTLPFRVGDTVKIKKGLLGGYTMRSKSGTSTRVNRIR